MGGGGGVGDGNRLTRKKKNRQKRKTGLACSRSQTTVPPVEWERLRFRKLRLQLASGGAAVVVPHSASRMLFCSLSSLHLFFFSLWCVPVVPVVLLCWLSLQAALLCSNPLLPLLFVWHSLLLAFPLPLLSWGGMDCAAWYYNEHSAENYTDR